MKNSFVHVFMVLSVGLLLSSCGSKKTLVNQSYTATATSYVKTNITSDPVGAMVLCEGKVLGTTPCVANLPVTATAVATHNGANVNTETTVKPVELLFVKGGVTESITVNPATIGAQGIQYEFKQAAYINDPTIASGEAEKRVSRENAGGTALERTIIRWYFDSNPQGVRLFWRVISSVPDEVKNTNELYLAPTPYEETRSFNILGLTYENSRDVIIEVKAKKNGYMDQVKRFNVRQAIDQQEISSFFEMVKVE